MSRLLPVVVVSVLVCFANLLPAQETTGTVSGRVVDPAGSSVPRAKVTVTNTDRNAVVREEDCDPDGYFDAPLLPIGHYSLSIEAKGFRPFEEHGIELNVNDHLDLTIRLELGTRQEQVSVQADSVHVETQNAAAVALITGSQIRETPLKTRNYEELVELMPGVTGYSGDTLYIGVSTPSGFTNRVPFSSDGSLNVQNNWTIDGADNVDRGGNDTLLSFPSADAIAEFKVLHGVYDAEFGRAAGAQINVITRSGTSRFHGGVYEFLRNDAFDAGAWLDNRVGLPKAPLRYNDFGGTFGGPVFIPGHYNQQKNKTFFFFSEEVRRVIESHPSESLVPTAAERTGDLTADGLGVISPSAFDPAAAAYLKDVFSRIPLPQSGHVLVADMHDRFNFREEIFRLDHSFNQHVSIFGRYLNDDIPTVEDAGLFVGEPVPGIATTHTNAPGRGLVLAATMLFSPTFLDEIGYTYSSGAVLSNNAGALANANSPDVAGLYATPGALPYPDMVNRIPSLFINFFSAFSGFGDYRDYNRNHSVYDNLTKVWGRHVLKFGGQFHWYQKRENPDFDNAGFFFFGDVTPGLSWQEFLLGQAAFFSQQSTNSYANLRQHVLELFAQDTWRMRSNLTLSYGVRFSRFGSPYDMNGRGLNFDPSKFALGKAAVVAADGNLCLFDSAGNPYDCDPGQSPNPKYDPFNGMVQVGKGQVTSTPVNFAPRVGIAWDVSSSGKTALRAGYGMYIDSQAVNRWELPLLADPPNAIVSGFAAPSFDQPGNNSALLNNAPSSLMALRSNWKQPYVQRWSLDAQHQFAHDILADVAYIGTTGTHLANLVDINQPRAGAYATALEGNPYYAGGQLSPGQSQLLNLLRPFPGYSSINSFLPIFKSNYHSLQANLQKKLKGDGLISLNYTWSKFLSNLHFPTDLTVPQVTSDLRQDYGPTTADRRHEFIANFVYMLPWFATSSRFWGHTLRGWELSGIAQFESGGYLSAGTADPEDPGGVGLQGNAMPDQVGDANRGAPHSAAQWFNTAAFRDVPCDPSGSPCAFRPGNARAGSILGPGVERWDLALFKNYIFRERAKLQFRAEAFNVLNHTNYAGVDTTLGSETFGQISSAHDNRILQFGLKLNF